MTGVANLISPLHTNFVIVLYADKWILTSLPEYLLHVLRPDVRPKIERALTSGLQYSHESLSIRQSHIL